MFVCCYVGVTRTILQVQISRRLSEAWVSDNVGADLVKANVVTGIERCLG